MSADLTLVRVSVRKDGAFGALLEGDVGGRPLCVTLERTYDSAQGEQLVKIPAGEWPCTRTTFHHGKPVPYETLEILVPGHTRLLFHRAGVETDLDGCVGVGSTFLPVGEVTGISGAVPAFERFWLAALRVLARKETVVLAVRA